MTSRQRLFRVFYRLGFTPWDGHPLASSLRELVEGATALKPGTALDIGCGTGDNALYLAGLGWDVTGVDYVAAAVQKARAKAAKRDVSAPGAVRFDQADATRLTGQGIGANFGLIIDNGCLHGMSADDRDAYVGEVTAVAAPDAHGLCAQFGDGGGECGGGHA